MIIQMYELLKLQQNHIRRVIIIIVVLNEYILVLNEHFC